MHTLSLAPDGGMVLNYACIIKQRLVVVFNTKNLALFDLTDGAQQHLTQTPPISVCIGIGDAQFLICHLTAVCVYTLDETQTSFNQTVCLNVSEHSFRKACLIDKTVFATGDFDNNIETWTFSDSDITMGGTNQPPRSPGAAQYTKAMAVFPKRTGRFVSGHTGLPPNLFVWQNEPNRVVLERSIECIGQNSVMDVTIINSNAIVVCTTNIVFAIQLHAEGEGILSRHQINNVHPQSWHCMYIQRPTYYAFCFQHRQRGNFLHIESTNRRAIVVDSEECEVEDVVEMLYYLNHVVTCSSDGNIRFYELPESVNRSWQSVSLANHIKKNRTFGNLPRDTLILIHDELLLI